QYGCTQAPPALPAPLPATPLEIALATLQNGAEEIHPNPNACKRISPAVVLPGTDLLPTATALELFSKHVPVHAQSAPIRTQIAWVAEHIARHHSIDDIRQHAQDVLLEAT